MNINEISGLNRCHAMDKLSGWLQSVCNCVGSRLFVLEIENGEFKVTPSCDYMPNADRNELFEFRYNGKGMKYSQWEELADLFMDAIREAKCSQNDENEQL